MPIPMLPPTKDRTWPADLDERAALDMKGLLQERPNRPFRPRLAVTPVKEQAAKPDAPCRQCGAFQRRIARLERAARERKRKYDDLSQSMRRRNARVASLEQSLDEARLDLMKAEQKEGKLERIRGELERTVKDKDAQISTLRERIAAMEQEERESRKVISTVLRAHDILAAKHRGVA